MKSLHWLHFWSRSPEFTQPFLVSPQAVLNPLTRSNRVRYGSVEAWETG